MSNGLLLDTCALIWMMEDATLASDAEAAILRSAEEGRLFLSPISAWEIGLLQAKGRLALKTEVEAWFAEALRTPGAVLAELSYSILARSTALPGDPPSDPADRIFIATGRMHQLSIVTRDRRILGYADAGYVSALAC